MIRCISLLISWSYDVKFCQGHSTTCTILVAYNVLLTLLKLNLRCIIFHNYLCEIVYCFFICPNFLLAKSLSYTAHINKSNQTQMVFSILYNTYISDATAQYIRFIFTQGFTAGIIFQYAI